MKKIFSLVMAMAMVIGLNAAPAALKQLKAPKSTSRMELVQKQIAHKAPMAATTVTLDPATQTPQTAETDIELTINGISVVYHGTLNAATDYAPADFRIYGGKTLTLSTSSNIVSVKIAGKANKAGFTLSVDKGTITAGASYTDVTEKATLDDPLIAVTNINATSVELSMGKQVRAYKIEVTLGEGDDTPPTPPTPVGDTTYITINHPTVLDSIADFGWIYVSGETEKYVVGAQINTDHLVGTYSNTDIEWTYTFIGDLTTLEYLDLASVDIATIAQVEDTLRFTFNFVASDGKVYIVTMNDYVVQPTGEEIYVNVDLPELTDATAEEGWFQVMGYNVTNEYYASLCVNTNNMFGNFTAADVDWEYTGIYAGLSAVQLNQSSFTMSVTTSVDTTIFHAEALDLNGVKYIINMKLYEPTPTEVITFTTIEASGEYSDEYGDYYVEGVNEAGDAIYLDIYMDKLASTSFTLEDMETYYSYIEFADGGFVEFYSVDGQLTVEGTTITITATIIGRDSKQYNVTIVVDGSQPSGDHTIVIADYASTGFTTLDGAYTVASNANGGTSAPAYNANGEDLRLYAKNTMTLTKNTKDGPMTKIVFNISEKGLTRQAEITPSVGKMAYDMTAATVTWTGNASEVTFTVGEKAVYGTDGDSKAGQFDFTSIDIEGAASGLISTTAHKVVNKCLINGQLMIIKEGKQYNVLGVAF